MIPLHKVLVAPDAHEKMRETLYSGLLTEGPRVKEFEAKLSEYLGCPVLATNSCTSAIELALQLIGVGPGDQIIASPLSCAASYVGAIRLGAQMVWADVYEDTGLIKEYSIADRITDRTKAIIVVDWGGRFVDCGEICRRLMVRDKPLPPIIQDAAHSFGARLCGDSGSTPAHSSVQSAEYVAWSWQAIKTLTTSDGGALKVPAYEFTRARAIRWFGIDRETKAKFRFLQDIPEAGGKWHMNDLTASLGLANFDDAVKAVEAHRWNAKWLHDALNECRVVKRPPPDDGSSWWFYSLRTPKPLEFVEFAEARGVGSGPVHGRCDRYTGFDRGHHALPGVDEYFSQHVAIPCGWWLSPDDLNKIADVVLEWDRTL